MKTLEVLKQDLLILFHNPTKWIKGNFAIDPSGNKASSYAVDACSWCLVGAIRRLNGEHLIEHISKQVTRYDDTLTSSEGALIRFNDHPNTTHETLLAFLKSLS